MLIPSGFPSISAARASLSRRVNANSQQTADLNVYETKLIKKGEC